MAGKINPLESVNSLESTSGESAQPLRYQIYNYRRRLKAEAKRVEKAAQTLTGYAQQLAKQEARTLRRMEKRMTVKAYSSKEKPVRKWTNELAAGVLKGAQDALTRVSQARLEGGFDLVERRNAIFRQRMKSEGVHDLMFPTPKLEQRKNLAFFQLTADIWQGKPRQDRYQLILDHFYDMQSSSPEVKAFQEWWAEQRKHGRSFEWGELGAIYEWTTTKLVDTEKIYMISSPRFTQKVILQGKLDAYYM